MKLRKWQRNILITPIVLLVRAPLMLALDIVAAVGRRAERARDWVYSNIPAWDR